MNKVELINEVAAQAKVSKAQAKAAIEAAIKSVSDALCKGDRVSLIGFGTFVVREKASRVGRNPLTKETIVIPAKKMIKFKAGVELSKKMK